MPRPTPKPVYVLHGQDSYLRRRHRRRIVAELVGADDPQLAVARFDSTATLSEVLDELRTGSLLARHRVVIVDEADDFVARCRKPLEEYLAKASPTGSLILAVKTFPASTRLARLATAIGEVLDCSAPDEGSLPRWIGQMAEERNQRISPEAAELLAAWIGPDLGRLDTEMEKLSLYVGPRRQISADDAAASVAATAGPVPFALTNALAAGNARAAFEALDSLLAQRGQEYRVLGLFGWYLRSRLEGKPMGPFGRRRAQPRRSPGGLQQDLRHVLRADLALKTGEKPLTTMQLLVARLCGATP